MKTHDFREMFNNLLGKELIDEILGENSSIKIHIGNTRGIPGAIAILMLSIKSLEAKVEHLTKEIEELRAK